MISKKPFFILGCVRSGTTMLRNILRMHPNLVAPEETHLYRWGEPFGTDGSLKQLANNQTLVRHREIDGISAEEFRKLLKNSTSRRDLYLLYMNRFMRLKKPEAKRWFDKTPQNVYGAAMLAADFPRSRFIHMVRNPLDVVTSLRIGEVMKVESLVGASNYWREAVSILDTLKRAYPKRVYEVRYEDFVVDPKAQTGLILDFLGEPYKPSFMDAFVSKPKSYDHQSVLTEDERTQVREICGEWAAKYHYEI